MISFLEGALKAIPAAAQSPLALTAYVAAITAWCIIGLRTKRMRSILQHLRSLPKEARLEALRAEMNVPRLRSGLAPEHWLRARVVSYYFYGFSIVVGALVFVLVLAGYSRRHESVYLDTMFRDQDTRAVAVDWLKRREGFFHIDDRELADSLARLLPDNEEPVSGDSLVRLTQRLNAIIKNHPMLQILRERAVSQSAPFQPIGINVRVGLPEIVEQQPPQCMMYVRTSSPLLGKRVSISNPTNGRSLVLFASGGIATPGRVDVHLNSEQVGFLFGKIVGGPTVEGVGTVQPGDGGLQDVPQSRCPSSELLFRRRLADARSFRLTMANE